MAKYVQFDYGTNEPTFYKVDNFSLENVKKLPAYKKKWLGMSFLDGKRRMFDGKILDIYPAQLISKVYYGKKISYERVLQIVGSDLRYKDLLWSMDANCRNSFGMLGLNITDDEEYDKQFKLYKEQFYKTHYCLFTLPNNFSAYYLEDNNTMTIEDFDSDIRLDYDKTLKNIQMNASVGKEYLSENQFTLELFKNYFEMLIQACKSYSEDIRKAIFHICYFHYEHFKNLRTIEEINFFLDICDYTYQFSNFNKELFNQYRDFINEQYKKLDDENNFGLV